MASVWIKKLHRKQIDGYLFLNTMNFNSQGNLSSVFICMSPFLICQFSPSTGMNYWWQLRWEQTDSFPLSILQREVICSLFLLSYNTKRSCCFNTILLSVWNILAYEPGLSVIISGYGFKKLRTERKQFHGFSFLWLHCSNHCFCQKCSLWGVHRVWEVSGSWEISVNEQFELLRERNIFHASKQHQFVLFCDCVLGQFLDCVTASRGK